MNFDTVADADAPQRPSLEGISAATIPAAIIDDDVLDRLETVVLTCCRRSDAPQDA